MSAVPWAGLPQGPAPGSAGCHGKVFDLRLPGLDGCDRGSLFVAVI